MLKELQKDPLRPLVVLGVGGGDLPVVVEGKADALELRAEAGDVLFRDDGGVDPVLDGVVLRRQAKGVVADGEKHVVALHAALAGDDVHGRVGARMAHVQARARGVGELDQGVELGLFMRFFRGEGVGVLPVLLPLLFPRRPGNRRVCSSSSALLFSKIEALRPQRDGRRCLSRYHSFLAIRPALRPLTEASARLSPRCSGTSSAPRAAASHHPAALWGREKAYCFPSSLW